MPLRCETQKGRVMRVRRPVRGTGRPCGLPHNAPKSGYVDTPSPEHWHKKTAKNKGGVSASDRAAKPGCWILPAASSGYKCQRKCQERNAGRRKEGREEGEFEGYRSGVGITDAIRPYPRARGECQMWENLRIWKRLKCYACLKLKHTLMHYARNSKCGKITH